MEDAISRQAAVHGKDHVGDPGKMVGDLISRAAVLDEIHKYMEERDYTIGTLYDNICEMPSAQPVEDASAMCGECDAWNQYKNYPHPGWIPCSERLPEEEKAYLVTFASGNVGMSSWHKDTFNRGFNRGFDACLTGVTEDGECEYFGVVAWMEKPEPWKGEQDG